MTQDDIIRMAREARLAEPYHPFNPWGASQEALERFAKLIAAYEREACERLAWDTPDDEETGIRTAIALAIRERGEK